MSGSRPRQILLCTCDHCQRVCYFGQWQTSVMFTKQSIRSTYHNIQSVTDQSCTLINLALISESWHLRRFQNWMNLMYILFNVSQVNNCHKVSNTAKIIYSITISQYDFFVHNGGHQHCLKLFNRICSHKFSCISPTATGSFSLICGWIDSYLN